MIRHVVLGGPIRRRILAGLVAVTFLLAVDGAPTLAQATSTTTATINGHVSISDGSSAQGVTVVFKDLATQKEYSAVVDNSGGYSVSVPTNARYQLVKATAPGGRTIPIQNTLPLVARGAGEYTQPTLAIVLPQCTDSDGDGVCDDADKCAKTAQGAQVDSTGCPAAGPVADKQPWYQRPGTIIGFVLGSAAVVGLALGANDNNASPY